jgi:hypothetical protein
MPDDAIERLFPALRRAGFEITSSRDQRYNCIAWAAGDVTRWWWPAESPFAYWPPGAAHEETVAGFIQAFAILGYEPAHSGDFEPQFEKVAIFASSDGIPTHMARQLRDGTWTSKLGALEDIQHRELTGLEGAEYGTAVVFLRRQEGVFA